MEGSLVTATRRKPDHVTYIFVQSTAYGVTMEIGNRVQNLAEGEYNGVTDQN